MSQLGISGFLSRRGRRRGERGERGAQQAAPSSSSGSATGSVPPSPAAVTARPDQQDHAGTMQATDAAPNRLQTGPAAESGGAAGRPEETRASTMHAPCRAPAQPAAPDSDAAAPRAVNAGNGGDGAGEEEGEGEGAGEEEGEGEGAGEEEDEGEGDGDDEGQGRAGPRAERQRSSAGQVRGAQTRHTGITAVPETDREHFVDLGHGNLKCIPCSWASGKRDGVVVDLSKMENPMSHIGLKNRRLCQLATGPKCLIERLLDWPTLEMDFIMPEVVIAELLPSLFPTMASGGAVLRVRECSLHLDFINILSAHSRLDGIELINCRFLGTTEDHLAGGLAPRLGTFSGLSSLSLSCTRLGMVLDCNHLAKLQCLHTLKLSNVHLNGFDILLANLPYLHTLHLSIARFPDEGVRLASSSVGLIVLGSLSPMFPEVSLLNFPALKRLDFWALDLATIPNSLDDAQKVQLVEHMASWLIKSPLEVGCSRTRSVDNEDYDMIRVKRSWSSDLCELMLEALQPLKEKYVGVRHFRARDWNLTGLASMTKLLSFLRDVESICLEKCKFGDAALEGGFLEAFKQLPRLQKLVLDVDVPPRDTLAVLAAAQLAGRRLELVLQPGNINSFERVRETEKEWQLLRKSLSPGSELEEGNAMVQLHVRGFPF